MQHNQCSTEHIPDKLGERVERQTEISEKGWEERMIHSSEGIRYSEHSPLPGFITDKTGSDDLVDIFPSAENCIQN
jgi:hypothetical protein